MRVGVLFFFQLLWSFPLFAQTPEALTLNALPSMSTKDPDGQITIHAVKVAESPLIDGKIDEAIYERVIPASGLIQSEPHAGEPETEKTEVWVFYDEENLYASIRCWDSHPERWVANELRRDGANSTSNESVYFVFDTFLDRRNGFLFGITQPGGLIDSTITNERDSNRDWNTIWDGKTATFAGGWSAELVIPFKSLRYPRGGPQTWGINVRRVIKWKDELLFLTEIPPQFGVGGVMKFSSAATLTGLSLPPVSRLVELKPYGITSVKSDRNTVPVLDNDGVGDWGADAKIGVTKSLTADLTYNTDFAQVEDDEQQVNLSRFSLFFPEKREFFLEGQGIFVFGGLTTRLRNSTPGDVPVLFFSRRIGLEGSRPVPIIGGARLTGKLNHYTVGAVNMQSDHDVVSGARATNFSVLRVKRDIFERSSIGFLATRRSIATTGSGPSETYGADGVFSFFTNLNINSYIARTSTPGRGNDDSSYRAQLDYTADKYAVQLERLAVGRDFVPDVGYVRRTDFRRSYGLFRFTPRTLKFQSVRKFEWEGSFDQFNRGTGSLDTREVSGAFRVNYKSSDQLAIEVSNQEEHLVEPFRVSGSVTVPVGQYQYQTVLAQYTLSTQHKLSGTVGYQQGGFYDGHKKTVSLSSARMEATSRLSLEPGLSLNWVDLPQGSFTATVLTTRTVYAFSPRTFASALLQYNSTTHLLTSNARLRWEYQPGSELFIVYSDARNTLDRSSGTLENRTVILKITKFFRM